MMQLGLARASVIAPRSAQLLLPLKRKVGVCKAAYDEQRAQDSVLLIRASSSVSEEDAGGNFGPALCNIVLGSVLLGERLNGEGLVHALELHNDAMHPLLMFSVAALVAAAAWPSKNKSPADGVGLVKRYASRVSYLGLAGTILAEMYTGKVGFEGWSIYTAFQIGFGCVFG